MPNVRCDAAEDYGRYATPPKFQIKFRSVECAPLVLRDHENPPASVPARERSPPNPAEELASASSCRRQDAAYLSVRRRLHAHQKHRHAVFPECIGEHRSVLYRRYRTAYGAICLPAIPFWRSMTTNAVFVLSMDSVFILVILPPSDTSMR